MNKLFILHSRKKNSNLIEICYLHCYTNNLNLTKTMYRKFNFTVIFPKDHFLSLFL